MLLKVFSVRDMKAEAFLQPYFTPTPGSALRAFGDACAKTDSPFYAHPNDYVLYEIGTYNDSDGMLSPLNPVKMMATAADFVKAPEKVIKGTQLGNGDFDPKGARLVGIESHGS